MFLLSREFGWTPDQIRDMRAEDVSNYISMVHIERKIREANQKKASHSKYGK